MFGGEHGKTNVWKMDWERGVETVLPSVLDAFEGVCATIGGSFTDASVLSEKTEQQPANEPDWSTAIRKLTSKSLYVFGFFFTISVKQRSNELFSQWCCCDACSAQPSWLVDTFYAKFGKTYINPKKRGGAYFFSCRVIFAFCWNYLMKKAHPVCKGLNCNLLHVSLRTPAAPAAPAAAPHHRGRCRDSRFLLLHRHFPPLRVIGSGTKTPLPMIKCPITIPFSSHTSSHSKHGWGF